MSPLPRETHTHTHVHAQKNVLINNFLRRILDFGGSKLQYDEKKSPHIHEWRFMGVRQMNEEELKALSSFHRKFPFQDLSSGKDMIRSFSSTCPVCIFNFYIRAWMSCEDGWNNNNGIWKKAFPGRYEKWWGEKKIALAVYIKISLKFSASWRGFFFTHWPA